MAQDGQVEQPPSAEDKKAPEASGGTLTAVAEAPVVADSKFTSEIKKPELKPGDQLPLFDLDDAIGITPVPATTQPAAEVKPVAKPEAAAVGTATAVTTEEEADKPQAKPQQIDIAPIDEPAANNTANPTATGPVAQPQSTGNAAAAQEEEADGDEPIKDTRYRSVFAKNSMPAINEVWPAGDVRDELKEALGLSGKVKKNDKYGLDFHMPNGHVIEWHANLGGAEFIGMRKRTSKFDEDDAHSVAVTAKARGWTAINVHGNQKQKEMMWLHAKMNGLDVANFEPMYSDDPNNVRNRLAAYLAEQNDGKVIGATPVQHQMNLAGGVPDHEQTTPDDDTPETPADGAKPDAKDAAKAEGDKPATDKPAEVAAQVETAAGDKPVTAQAAAAEGAEVKTTFGKIEPPAAKGEGEATPAAKNEEAPVAGKVDAALVKSITEEIRAANPDNPEAQESLAAVDKAVKGTGGVAAVVADAANEKGVALETKEKPETAAPAVADTGAKTAKAGGGKPPKPGR